MKYVGKTYSIHDARAKVTGSVIYAGDMTLPRMGYAKLLLSPVPHGLITALDTSEAESLPGVIKVFSHHNSPEVYFNSCRLVPGQHDCVADEPLFPREVMYVGDRVAVVVADSPETARIACGLIRAEYRALPVVADLGEIYRRQPLAGDFDDRLIDEYVFETGPTRPASPESGIKREVETRVKTPKTHHAAMEPHVCLADYNHQGRLTIWTPCQGVYGVRTVVADLLGLDYQAVRVVKTPMGGSFGGKQEALLEPVAAFLALQLRRPVRLQLDRREAILSTMTRPATITRINTRVDENGLLTSCDIQSLLDAGAYVSSSTDYIRALGAKISRLYNVGRVTQRARAYRTNSTKAGGARGWGSPEFFTAMEIHMDQIAVEIGLDPVALHLNNVVRSGDMDQIRQVSLGRVGISECIQQGAEAFRWSERYGPPVSEGRLRRGVGLACGAHTNGMVGGFPDFSTMTLTMNEDGTFLLNTCLHDMGCGTITSMKQIVAEILDIDPARVLVLEADTDRSPYDFGTYASRVTYVCGASAMRAAEAVRGMILKTAGRKFKHSSGAMRIADGGVRIDGRPGRDWIGYDEIARLALMEEHSPIMATGVFDAQSNPGAYAAHFAEVEVDIGTGLVRVVDYLAVHDVGRAVNPGMVEGQIQGAVQMGIGYALTEQVAVDAAGGIKMDGFKDYHLVNAPDMPEVRVLLLEGGGDEGPFGAKSVGEISMVPVAAAVVNAVNNALGTRLSDLPLVPAKILEALDR